MKAVTLPHNSRSRQKATANLKGTYIEKLTAEILACLDDLFSDDMDDEGFLKGQERVRAIITREYVEVDRADR